MVDVKIEPSWKELLKDEFEKPYFSELIQFVKNEYKTTKIYPPGKLIFNAFDHCPAEQTKVVILGQDPYHGPGPSTRALFFRSGRHRSTTFITEHFQRNK